MASSDNRIEIDTIDTHREASVRLISNARRQLSLYTRDLEAILYGHPLLIDSFKQFAITSREGYVRIIIQDPIAARKKHHPLIDLAQKLPSSFQFRVPVEPEDLTATSAFLRNDRGGYLFRLFADRYEGNWSKNHPARNKQLLEEFERIWQRSRLCTEFRTLAI